MPDDQLKPTKRPAWAYTLSAAIVAFALSSIVTVAEDGYPSDFTLVLTVIAWILGAGGAIQFLMSRKE